MNQKYQCKSYKAQWIISLFVLLATACTPDSFGSKIVITRATEVPPNSTAMLESSDLLPRFTPTPLPTEILTASATPELMPTVTEIIPLPTNVVTTTNNSNLIQVSSVPGSMSWQLEDRLRLGIDSKWDSETHCTTNFWQDFDISRQTPIEVTFLASGDVTLCSEPKPTISEASIASLPGAMVSQEVSADRTHSLLFVEVISSTLPMLGNVTEVNAEANLPIREGWVINHETGDLSPIFATQLGYYYSFLPGNQSIVIQSACYGANLGSGLHIINVENRSLLKLAENYSGLCEGNNGLSSSPNGQYLIYGKGIVISVEGEFKDQICTDEQFPRSWAWSSNNQHIYIDCYHGEQDFIWQYDIDTQMKVLLNELAGTSISFKARSMAVSPDEKWLAFIWGASDLFPIEEYGVWLLRLE